VSGRWAGLLAKWNAIIPRKRRFGQPPGAQIDVSYTNISGTFHYLCGVLNGYGRFLVHWELCPSMTKSEIEIVLGARR
jgi:putative transposase